jgi:transposase
MPPERLKEVVSFVPDRCSQCHAPLPFEAGPEDPPPTWHQVAELPLVAAEITEYQGHYRTCPCCGEVNHAAIPEDIRSHSVGPRLSATLSYLAGSHGMSKRALEEITEVVFEAPIALGTVANLEQETSAALAGAHQEALQTVAEEPIKNVDETGWKENGKKRWLWVAATSTLAVFIISPWRNLKALTRLLGARMVGILCSDRWKVYNEWPVKQRQVCWAHWKRNWEKLAQRGGQAKKIAQGCLDVHRRVFELWHLYRGGGLTKQEWVEAILPVIRSLVEILGAGARSRDDKLARHCDNLLQVWPALWTFVWCAGVEPTNNHGERVLRLAVLWRRRSFGWCRQIVAAILIP